jgi:Putative peptidoglycan binding domain
MRWGPRGRLALILAAAVGVVAGTLVGFATTGENPDAEAKDPSGSPTVDASGSPTDPLRLGVPLHNLDCTTDKILVVGWGETSGALESAVQTNSDSEAKYLETADSCNTLYGPEGQPAPKYVVYIGPFDTTSEPCGLRMSVDHKGDAVTSLKPGQKTHVPCLCVLRPADFPSLSVGMHPSTRDGIYVRALQQMLLDIGLITANHVTGYYDEATARVVTRLQKLNALTPAKYGTVERLTWNQIIDRGCVGFDF